MFIFNLKQKERYRERETKEEGRREGEIKVPEKSYVYPVKICISFSKQLIVVIKISAHH